VNRFTIGSFPDSTTGAAREEAKRLKRGIDGGADPVGDLLENRAAPTGLRGSKSSTYRASAYRPSATTGNKSASILCPP
jgi:hypothetical protein